MTAACLVALAGAAGAIAVTRDSGRRTPTLVASDSACTPNWPSPTSGRTVFTVTNTSAHVVYALQIAGASRKVYGRLDQLAPQTSDQLDVVLPRGDFTFQCYGDDGYVYASKPVAVGGAQVRGLHPYGSLSPVALAVAMKHYRAGLAPLVRRLVQDTDSLQTAVAVGNFARALTLWLAAHLDYARIGVGYDTFGKFNGEISGGFRRLEHGPWHGDSQRRLAPAASALDRSVRGLAGRFPTMVWANTDLPLRAHEILENTLQFELTGETDEGSHTNLATAWANAQGTSRALAALAPLLQRRNPQLLAASTRGAARLTSSLGAYDRAGRWTPLAALTRLQRERLDSQTSGLLEQLERIPDELQLELATPSGGS